MKGIKTGGFPERIGLEDVTTRKHRDMSKHSHIALAH